jgi:HK97 family phage prohead protease
MVSARDAEHVTMPSPVKFVGLAVPINSLSVPLLGGFFRELWTYGALDRTFYENIDVRALSDHDSGKLFGRLHNGTLRMRREPRGLVVEIDPPQTSFAQDAIESVGRGDLVGMSFAFTLMPGGDSWDDTTDPPTRTIHDARIHEVSIVAFPAFPSTNVHVASRSWQREYRPGISVLQRRLQLQLMAPEAGPRRRLSVAAARLRLAKAAW